jgi:AcrR family transcriptional regulator
VDSKIVEDEPRGSEHRGHLSQTLILTEAIRFIDEQGLDRLTMRQLGARLGVEAMALYRYVPGRARLLDGVVEVLMDELYQDTMVDNQAASWQEYVQQLAHSVRRLALMHPQVFPLVASRPPAAPWLRPPLRSLRWVEAFLERLIEYGFSQRTSVAAYRSFATFLLGHLLLETSAAVGLPVERHADGEFIESSDLADYPLITELGPQLAVDAFGDEFDAALEDLIDRLGTDLA